MRSGTGWYVRGAVSGSVLGVGAGVVFGVLTPVVLVALDLYDAYVRHVVAPPSGGVGGFVVVALLVFMVATLTAATLGLPLGGAVGAMHAVVARFRPGRSVAAPVVDAALVGVGAAWVVPALVVGTDVLAWIQLLTGAVAGTASGLHLWYVGHRMDRVTG